MAQLSRTSVSHLLISLALITAVGGYEAYRPNAYIPIAGDTPTIGFGTTVYPDGVKVRIGDKLDRTQAETYLKGDLDKYKQGFTRCVKVPLYDYEFNAYMSLTYNIGVAGFCGSSIPEKLNTGNYADACKTLLLFNKMKDTSKPKVRNVSTGKMQYQYKIVKGLDNRRKIEYHTCIGKK